MTPDAEQGRGPSAMVRLTKKLEEVSEELRKVTKGLSEARRAFSRTNVRVWIVIVGFALDLVVTGFIGDILVQQVNQNHANERIQQEIHDSQIQGCLLGNQFRMKQRDLFAVKILHLNPQPANLSPAMKMILGKYISAVDETYIPLNCQALYKVPK